MKEQHSNIIACELNSQKETLNDICMHVLATFKFNENNKKKT